MRQWLSEHPRFRIHYTPTSGSWLNAVERVFRDVKQKCLRRRSVESVEALETAIGEHLDLRNQTPKPFQWKAPVVEILREVNALGGCCTTLMEPRNPPPPWTVSTAISTVSTPHPVDRASVETAINYPQ